MNPVKRERLKCYKFYLLESEFINEKTTILWMKRCTSSWCQ